MEPGFARKSALSLALVTLLLATIPIGCGIKESVPPKKGGNCAADSLSVITGETGSAMAFLPDPMISSGNASLLPQSSALDTFRSSVSLERLGGRGVLEGQYVDVRDANNCEEWFGAFDPNNQFNYSRADARFQEAMAYYFSDQYLHHVSSNGYLHTGAPIRVIVHCGDHDEAYYTRWKDPNGQLIEFVCLGESAKSPGMSYSDDASVTVHELQHGITGGNYSLSKELNQLYFDEAGAMNEAISDFMALMYLEPLVTPSNQDERVFSRWALGTFNQGRSGIRGAHKCPAYDLTFPNCTGFPGFNSATNTISYVYPDGLGWPYANNYTGPGYVSNVFKRYRAQEEIHNVGAIITGALWDAYEAIKANHGGSSAEAGEVMTKLVNEAIRHLPQPTINNRSPVTFRELASQLVNASSSPIATAQDTAALIQALTARGLYGGQTINNPSWASAGPGMSQTPGLRIVDDPLQLKTWLFNMRRNPEIVQQGLGTGINGQADPGEVLAVWFDLKNNAELTAGGVLLTVTSLNPNLEVLTYEAANYGGISPSQAQIRYSKINGTQIVTALSQGGSGYTVPTGNTYFTTNPYFAGEPTLPDNNTTAMWLRVSPNAQKGEMLNLQVTAAPTNGVSSTVVFSMRVN